MDNLISLCQHLRRQYYAYGPQKNLWKTADFTGIQPGIFQLFSTDKDGFQRLSVQRTDTDFSWPAPAGFSGIQ